MELFVAGCGVAWSVRATSCYLIDKHILFDCGEGTSKNITKFYGEEGVNNVDCIFLTHFHTDHLFGISQYVAKLTNRKAPSSEKLTIVGGKGLYKIMDFLVANTISSHHVNIDDFLNIIEIDDFNKDINVCEYYVKPYKLKHGELEDIGYAIKTPDGIWGYTGDTMFNDDLINMASNCDVLLCDVSGDTNTMTHNGVEGYHKLKEMFPNLSIFAVHCSNKVFSNVKQYGINIVEEMKEYTFKNGKLKSKV